MRQKGLGTEAMATIFLDPPAVTLKAVAWCRAFASLTAGSLKRQGTGHILGESRKRADLSALKESESSLPLGNGYWL